MDVLNLKNKIGILLLLEPIGSSSEHAWYRRISCIELDVALDVAKEGLSLAQPLVILSPIMSIGTTPAPSYVVYRL